MNPDLSQTAELQLAREVFNLAQNEFLTVNDVGWTSRVYLYRQGERVIKFPRYEAVRQEYANECSLYAYLESCYFASVQLPQLWAIGLNYDYVAYTGIPGETLDLACEKNSFDEVQKLSLGRRIGAFLKVFHGLAFEHCAEETPQQEVEVLKQKYRLSLPYLQVHLTDEEILLLTTLVTRAFSEKILQFQYEPVLCHGDLGLWNMVYRQTPAGIQLGIIDFGDICYGDAARDFVGLSDPVLRDAALRVYGELSALDERVFYRQQILPILELPYYLGKANQAGIDQTFLRIRKLLRSHASTR